jgi:mannose-1-phosphate guanylyltransferase
VNSEQKIYAVVMAGGIGSRFWPRSREKHPKQLLEISPGGTMIQNTIRRLNGFIPEANIFIVTNKAQRSLALKQLPQLAPENVLIEPIGRNTAACIGLSALFVHRLSPDGVMLVLPADHLIQQTDEFLEVVRTGIQVAHESSSLVTIGIKPTRPETGYGYIQFVDEPSPANPYFSRGVFRVKTFAEKPVAQVAEQFLKSGDFLWNSGMFIWRADSILKEIQRLLPETYEHLKTIEPTIGTTLYDQILEHAYRMMRSISVDYGVMEKAKDVYVLKGEFGWNDVGSWDEVYRISQKDEHGNVLVGNCLSQNAKNSYIYSEDKLIATVGVDDLIVIDTPDALLICKRGESQDVKEIVDYLRRKQMNEYL